MKANIEKIVKLELTEEETQKLIRLLNNYVETEGIELVMDMFRINLSDILKRELNLQ